MNEDRRRRDDDATKILTHLFKLMCDGDPEFESPQARRAVAPAYFAQWLQANINLMNGVEICGELECIAEAWEFVNHVASSGNMMPLVMVWPRIVLGHNASPKHALKSINLVMLLEWEDGKILPISSYTPREFVPKAQFTDGIAASLMVQQAQNNIAPIMEHGLDGIHDGMSDGYGGEEGFNTFMGMLLKAVQGIDPKVRPLMEKWMRLTQGMVRPPIPPHLREQINKVRAQMAAQDGQPKRGGWTNE